MALSIGDVLNNRYRIVNLLGQGGFGAVYRAWDTNFAAHCALKENVDSTPEAQRQFAREAQILHTLRHPNLPLVKDYFQVTGHGQYLVMDYVEGEDLQQTLEKTGKPLPQEQALTWIEQVCEALTYLHAQTPPVIHRDIKPANIKITPQGKAVLVDFGIAKKFDPKMRTTVGARAVTPGYSPFEQYGKAPTDIRTDVYALGATLYALLTGQEPTDSIARMAGAELPAPRSLNAEISAEVEAVVLKAMQVMPDQRYQSVADFKAELHKVFVALQSRVLTASPAPAIAQAQVVSVPASLPAWWPVVLQGGAAVLIGLLMTLAPEIDIYELGNEVAVYALAFSAISMASLHFRPSLRLWRLLAGMAGFIASAIVLTIDLYMWWDYTGIPDVVHPLLGGAMAAMGLVTLITALRGSGWGAFALGIFMLLLSVFTLFIEPIQDSMDIYLATPVGIVCIVGGGLAFLAGMFERK